MSEIGKLRQQDNSGDTISSVVIINELDLVNKLLARAEKAEATLESAQKMYDHCENKTAYWKLLAKETETARSRSILLGQMESILNAVDVETRHPSNEVGERKPMTLGEWVQWLVKSRHEWRRIARENEARAEKAEVELFRFMNMPSCSPELFLRSAQRAEKPAPVDWDRVRIESAMLILRLLPSNSVGDGIIEEVTKGAVKWANALVAELKKEEEA
jgi:hypothetical protein